MWPASRPHYRGAMTEFLLLVAPSANRVYAAYGARLMVAEAHAFLPRFGDVGECTVTELAAVPYVAVQAEDTEQMRAAMAHLSGAHAVFVREGDLLRPVLLPPIAAYGDDLVTIPKYAGKTNEQWTRLCLNVTVAATRAPQRLLDRSLTVMDPMCGRGTTLNLALMLGLDSVGVDLDRQDFAAYETFIKTWMRQHRVKHEIESGPLRRDGATLGSRLTLRASADKAAFKAGGGTRVTFVRADTTALTGLVRSGSVDVIVTDTPYGVQHGSHGDVLSRRPLAVLERAIDGWLRILRTGGAVGLSVNRHVAPVADVATLLQDRGLTVVEHEGAFRHRVDAAIDRDLVVATKG